MRSILATAAGLTILGIGACTIGSLLDNDPSCSFSVAHDVCLVQNVDTP